MILSSVKQQIISEEQKKKERGLSSRFIAQNFNDTIAKYFYKENKITLIEKEDNHYVISHYDVENFDYRIIENKQYLVYAIIPENIKRLRTNAFIDSSTLTNVYLPKSLEYIGNNCFSGCYSLQEFTCPENLQSIQKNSFSKCENLKIFNTNNNLQEIQSKAFEYCYNLEQINFPKSVTKIGVDCFAYCTNLKLITLPNELTEISHGLFHHCINLQEVKLPQNLITIKSRAFESCRELVEIVVPDNVNSIESFAFSNCYALQKVVLPSNITSIDDYCFENCYELSNINIPENVKNLKSRSFYSCIALKNISLPDSLKTIGSETFNNTGLKSIEIPSSVEYVGKKAFSFCRNLDTVVINGPTEFDFDCFDNKNLSFIAFDEGKKILCKTLPKHYNEYIELPNNKDRIRLLNTLSNFNYCVGIKIIDYYNKTGIVLTYKYVKDLLSCGKFDDFINHSNKTFYSKIYKDNTKNFSEAQIYTLEKFCTILGIFENPNTYLTIKGKPYKYDFATCAYNFFRNNIENFKSFELFDNLDGLKFREFNSQLAKFLMNKTQRKKEKSYHTDSLIPEINNFNKILNLSYNNKNVLTKICNNFETLQQYNQKNKGSHKTLAPNVESYSFLLKDITYEGVTTETKGIAQVLNQISANQEMFDVSVELYNNINQKHFNHHILGTALTKTIHFDEINKSFTYEFLDKYDPYNLILGLKTSSCASITNPFGNGIVKANYLHQNIQNMVIRDSSNNIIAKATLYVNSEQQYGVFNTFMLYSEVPNQSKPYIYDCFMQGVKDFATQYNIEHPDLPIYQINIGQSRNKLNEQFCKYNTLSDVIFNCIDFSSYLTTMSYALINDFELNQYVIWNLFDEVSKQTKNLSQTSTEQQSTLIKN